MNSFIWWVLFLIACLFLELSSPGYFFFLSFSIGALFAAGLAWYDVNSVIQFIVFIITSIGGFLFLRQYVKGFLTNSHYKSNVYALLGKKGVVTETISECEKGWVKIDGEIWSAASVNGSLIEKDALVEVVSFTGSHVKVKKIGNHC